MVSKRSELRSKILDRLHEDGIEIVSPNFMNQRQLPPDLQFMPQRYYHPESVEDRVEAEKIMFDKADLAARVETFRSQRQRLIEELKSLADDADSFERTWRERQVASLDDFIKTLEPDPTQVR